MSVYLFVPSVLGLLLTYVSGSDIRKVPFHFMVRDVLFRMPSTRLYFLSANCAIHVFR